MSSIIRPRSSCSAADVAALRRQAAILRLMSSTACSASFTCATWRLISASASVRSRTVLLGDPVDRGRDVARGADRRRQLGRRLRRGRRRHQRRLERGGERREPVRAARLADAAHHALVGVRAHRRRAERRVHAAALGGQERVLRAGGAGHPHAGAVAAERQRRQLGGAARRIPASSRSRRCSRWCRPAAPRPQAPRRRCSARSRCSCLRPFLRSARHRRISASGWWFPAASRPRSG